MARGSVGAGIVVVVRAVVSRVVPIRITLLFHLLLGKDCHDNQAMLSLLSSKDQVCLHKEFLF